MRGNINVVKYYKKKYIYSYTGVLNIYTELRIISTSTSTNIF